MINTSLRAPEFPKPEHAKIGWFKDGLLSVIRSSKIAKWASIGGSVFVSGGAVELSTGASPAVANPNHLIKCNLNDSNRDTLLCNRTEAQIERFCSSIAAPGETRLDPKGMYTEASRGEYKTYKIKYLEPTPGGCDPAGKEEITYGQELSLGSNQSFLSHGEVEHRRIHNDDGLNDRHPATTTLDIPFSCAAAMPGAAVRPVLSIEWLPTPGWTTMGPTQSTVLGSPEPIC